MSIQRLCDGCGVDAQPAQLLDVRDLDAVEVVHRQHATARALPVDARHDHVVAAGKQRRDLLGGPSLVHEVDLVGRVALELPGERAEVDHGLDARPDRGEPADRLDVPPDDAVDAGVLHLHGHVGAVVQPRAVDLGERGGGDRLAIELGVQLVDRPAELALDERLHLLPRPGRDGVVDQRHRLHVLLAEDVGAAAEELHGLDDEPLLPHGAAHDGARGAEVEARGLLGQVGAAQPPHDAQPAPAQPQQHHGDRHRHEAPPAARGRTGRIADHFLRHHVTPSARPSTREWGVALRS